MANFFLIHTPFHQFVVEKIIENQVDKIGEINILIYEFEKNFTHTNERNEIDFDHVGGRVPGRSKYLISENNILFLKNEMRNYSSNTIYLSDIAWPMNNRIFFDKSLNCKYYLFIDGIGNYIGQTITFRLFFRNVVKWILGVLGLGVKYTPYVGDVMGQYQNKIECIFGFSIKYLSAPLKRCREINLSRKNIIDYKSKINTGIFLDQPYISGYKNWSSLRLETMKTLKLINVDKWYYKSHHFGRLEDGIDFVEPYFEKINSRECIEKIFEYKQYDTVVAYNSTALFTLKIMFGDKIKCIALDEPNLVLAATQNDKNANGKLLELFKKIGVEVIRIKI